MRDLHNNLKAKMLLAPDTITGDTDSASLDLLGYDSVELIVMFGDAANALSGSVYWTVAVEESDDDSTFTAVTTATDLLFGANPNVATPAATTGVIATLDADDDEDKLLRVGYVGSKRYIRITLDETGDSGDADFCVIGLRGHPKDAPGLDVAAEINL